MNTFLKIALGCLIIPIVLVVVLVVVGFTLRQASPPEHREERANLEQPVVGLTEAQLAAEGLHAAGGAPIGRPLPVDIVLEEGNFTVVAGPAGSSIRVEGNYDAGSYDLTQEMTKDSSGNPRYKLSFRPRHSMFRRLLSEGGVHVDADDNKLTIFLPRGIPMAMIVRISKGRSDLQLGGIALESAAFDLSMGEHTLSVTEANPLEMSSLKFNTSMGESRLTDLGNLRAGDIEVWGKMGEVKVDFGEKLERDTRLVARMKMGEMHFIVPRDARVKARTNIFLGESTGKIPDQEVAGGFLLDIDTSASLGGVNYRRN